MQCSLFCADATGRVIDEQTVEKIQAVVVEAINENLAVVANPLRERSLEVRERGYAGPVLFRWRAEDAISLLAGHTGCE